VIRQTTCASLELPDGRSRADAASTKSGTRELGREAHSLCDLPFLPLILGSFSGSVARVRSDEAKRRVADAELLREASLTR
jgi:hypothetical protein